MTTPEAAGARSVLLEAALRKARWRLIPLLSICYLVAYMDRVNISFAAESMNRALHFTPKIYGLGAGLFFLPYALCEIPASRMLLRFGARRWLARIMLTWGLLAAAMMLIRTPWSFYCLRMLLGVAEAGYFPGALYYLSQWFPERERARAASLFYVSFPLSSVVMGGLAGTLLGLDGKLGLAGWQWLFVVEAMPAIVLSAVIFFALPDTPKSAKWLADDEREALEAELARESGAAAPSGSKESNRRDLLAALRSRHVWGFGLITLCALGSQYAVNFSLPIVLRGATGWSMGRVGWLIAGVGLLGALAMIVGAVHSDKTNERKWHVVGPMLVMAIAILIAGMRLNGWIGVVALIVAVVSYYAYQGPMLCLYSMALPGRAAAVGIAAINTCAIAGGFVGPYWMGWMREATGSYAVGVGGLSVPCLLAALCMLWLLAGWNQREADRKRIE